MRKIFGKQVYDSLKEVVDPRHSAILVVDMQKDFCSSGGYFDKAGLNITGVKEILPDYIHSKDDVVDIQGEITHLEVFYSFLERVKQGEKSDIRLVTNTSEGAPMLHNLVFDGKSIQSTYDSTRDGYG